MATANGPWIFDDSSSRPLANPHTWTRLGHVLYVDQPVGSGLSTSSDPYPAQHNERITTDFYNWLRAFYAKFPHLATKNTHMLGESYAGIYIPYFATMILENQHKLPVNLKSIGLGDGIFGNFAAMGPASVVEYMRSQQQQLEVTGDIMEAFDEAGKTCGFNDVRKNATLYPPPGPITISGDPEHLNSRRSLDISKRGDSQHRRRRDCNISPKTTADIHRSIFSDCYGPCAIFSTAMDYFITRADQTHTCFSLYDIKSTCETPNPDPKLERYLSRQDVQSALHLPKDSHKEYTICNQTILGIVMAQGYVEPPAYHLIPRLLDNYNLDVHIYEGEMDMLVNHIGIELVIQNMTWKGLQGFSRKPDRPFVQRRDRAWVMRHGTWGAERGLSYHLFTGAGHEVPKDKSEAMFVFVRDFVVGEQGYRGIGDWRAAYTGP